MLKPRIRKSASAAFTAFVGQNFSLLFQDLFQLDTRQSLGMVWSPRGPQSWHHKSMGLCNLAVFIVSHLDCLFGIPPGTIFSQLGCLAKITSSCAQSDPHSIGFQPCALNSVAWVVTHPGLSEDERWPGRNWVSGWCQHSHQTTNWHQAINWQQGYQNFKLQVDTYLTWSKPPGKLDVINDGRAKSGKSPTYTTSFCNLIHSNISIRGLTV